jgi:hypothetical protein
MMDVVRKPARRLDQAPIGQGSIHPCTMPSSKPTLDQRMAALTDVRRFSLPNTNQRQ